MTVPAILRAWSASAVERVLRRATGTTLDFRPTHLISGHGIRGTRANDLIGEWHLVSEGGGAETVRASYGSSDGFYIPVMRVVAGESFAWQAENITSWNFSSYFAVLMVTRYLTTGGGGYYVGNIKGPDIGDPHPLGGTPWPSPKYGEDLGWAISSNGPGNFGAGIYGDAAEPGRFDINFDGGPDMVDGLWRSVLLVYSSGVPNAYLRTADAVTFDSGSPGDITSTDGIFRFGACDYFGNKVNTGTIEIAAMMSFEGDAVTNIWTHNAKIATLLQEDLGAL